MRIAIAADHTGITIRDDIAEVIRSAGHDTIILGGELNGPDDDYPRFAKLVGDAIAGGRARSEERRVGKECRSRWSPYH